jgi:hypothetical protein
LERLRKLKSVKPFRLLSLVGPLPEALQKIL